MHLKVFIFFFSWTFFSFLHDVSDDKSVLKFRKYFHACTACVCQSLELKGDLEQMDTPVRAIVFSRFLHVFLLPSPQYLTEFYSSFEDMLPIDTIFSVSVLCKYSKTTYLFSSVPNN